MLSAFNARPIVELKPRDKSRIEAILAYGDRLLVGLNTGSLRIYRVNEATISSDATHDGEQSDERGSPKPKQKVAELLREQEKFSRYKIEQLAIVKEANILISLSNAVVSIYDLQSYELQEQLTKTKGASAFAVTSNIVKDPSTGVPSIVSRLAVAVKRRLLLWSWHDMELEEETSDIALPSSIRTLTWATGKKIVAGLSQSYVLVDVDNQDVDNIVGPGSIGGAPGQDTSRLGGTMSYIGMGSMIPKPLATQLGEGEILLAKDVNTHFIDSEKSQPLNRRQIPWATAPEAIGYSYPYLLALREATKGTLEVRNPETLSLLQSISLPGANLLQVAQPNISLAHAGKGFLVASDRIIWRMGALGYDDQIDALVEGNQLDEAISLLGMLEDALVRDKEGRMREIKMQKAQLLFDNKKFRDSLDLFTEVSAPPERVIKLYPPLISGDLALENADDTEDQNDRDKEITDGEGSNIGKPRRPSSSQDIGRKGIVNPAIAALKDHADDKSDASSIRTAASSPSKPDKELQASVRELRLFLAEVRRRLQRFFNPDNTLKDTVILHSEKLDDESHIIVKQLLGVSSADRIDIGQRLIETATLTDTTLFRAHMFASPSLVGSLFRIANFCDPEVVMEKLEETGRHNEMIDFLFGKKLHRQALEKLRKFGQAEDEEETAPQLQGPARTVAYLQHLPASMIDLILEYAEWPVRVQPELGMEIFLADTETAETLPRDKVFVFLKEIDKTLAIKYLEHAIDELNDQSTELHEELLTLYLEQLSNLDATDSKYGNVQSKLLLLLRLSTHYSPAKLLRQLPTDDSPAFNDARAIVYSKMGQHKQALEIYVFKLHDPQKAEEYCNRIYLEHTQEATTTATQKIRPRKVSTTAAASAGIGDSKDSIYHILLSLYVKPPKGEKEMWTPAIELLARHGSRLPAGETLDLIPHSVLVRELEFYFRGRMRGANELVALGRVEVGLRKVEAVKVQERLLSNRNRRVRVDDERLCGVCFKRLGGSVVSVFPDNSVVHLGCANRKQ